MKIEVEKIKCLFDKNRIVIRLNNDLNKENKYYLYIGKIISACPFNFEIECIIIYKSINLMNEHIQKVISSQGFNALYEEFSKLEKNILVMEINNK